MSDRTESGYAAQPRLRALLLGMLLLVVVTVVVSAWLTPLLYMGIEALSRFPFPRVLRRVAMLAACVPLILGLRWLGVRRMAQLGLGLSGSRLQSAVRAFAVGLSVIAAIYALEIALGARIIGHQLTMGRVAVALVAAIVIGVVEEGFFRGGLLFPFGRLRAGSFWVASAATSALYATVHFARGGGGEVVDGLSGWRVWALVPATALEHGEAWVGLFATGALFYSLAARQGHAWGAVGLHAGAVLGLQTLGEWSGPIAGKESFFFVDGRLPGYGIALLALITAVWLARRLDPAPAVVSG